MPQDETVTDIKVMINTTTPNLRDLLTACNTMVNGSPKLERIVGKQNMESLHGLAKHAITLLKQDEQEFYERARRDYPNEHTQ